MKWNETTIGDNVTTKKGFAFKSTKYVSNGVPVVRVSNYTLDSISDADLKYYPIEEKTNYLDYQLHEKDVIVQTVGSWQNNPDSVVGKVVRVPYFLDGALLNQNAVILIPKKSINREFLFYRLKTDEFKGHVIGEARGAANQASITLETIKSFKFLLPDYDEQFRIASILSAYDDLIENNQKQIKLLEEAAQRLYTEWFVDLHFPGYEDTKIVDGVPEGWKNTDLGHTCLLRKETITPDKIQKGIPYIGLEHMPRKDICLSEWGDSSTVSSNKYRYYSDDIIFGKIRPYFHKVGFALNDGIASTDSIIIKCENNLWGLILLIVSSEMFVNYSYQNCREGAKMPRADWKQMKKYPVLIADNEIMSDFNRIIWNITRKIKFIATQNRNLTEARDRLLPKLMSGELEV